MNLRTQFGPLATQFLNPILGGLVPGFELPCVAIPLLEECEGGLLGVTGEATDPAVEASIAPAPPGRSPIDDVLAFASLPTVAPAPGPSTAERIADGAGGLGSFLKGAADSLLGVGS